MKKRTIIYAVALLTCVSFVLPSCIGSFKLSNKVLTWNKGVSQSKFVNEVVFFAFWVLPVYEVTTLADLLVINSIEFWSGSNPIAANDIEKTVKGEKGEYIVKYKKDGYRITSRKDKVSVDLVFDQQTQTWSAMSKNKPVKFMTFVGDNKVKVYLPKGKTMEVELSEEGMVAFRQAMERNYPDMAKN